MPCIIPKNLRCCLTCTYWCGARRVNSADFYAECDSCNTKGQCAKSSSWSSEKEATRTGCSDWKEWEALRR